MAKERTIIKPINNVLYVEPNYLNSLNMIGSNGVETYEVTPDLEDYSEKSSVGSAPMYAAAAPQALSMRSLDDLDDNIGETWAEMLFRLIDEKGFNPVDVYKRSNINKKLFSKINSNNHYFFFWGVDIIFYYI